VPTDTAWWDLWVAKGDRGDAGIQGLQGATGVDGTDGEPGPNMIVAMGYVEGDGTLIEGYKVTSCSWNNTYLYYDIALTGITYTVSGYVTVITPQTGFNVDRFAYDVGAGGHLQVRFYSQTPSNIQSSFSFMVLQCP
jgi:hypothetical protein